MHRDGTNRTAQSLVFPIQAEHSFFLGCINRDITGQKKIEEEKKRLQEQLFQSQKMESIGRLAGGIAHDFNNILTSIIGYAELLKIRYQDTSTEEGEAAKVILRGAERAAHLTKQLLGFARKGKFNPVPVKINEIIRESIYVTAKMFEKNIEIICDLEEKLPAVEGDRNQLDQVVTNLLINAKDAMPEGGTLWIKAKVFNNDNDFPSFISKLDTGKYVKVTIKDTGTGIPEDIKDHIFEPFFTTKEEGKGTGLGLATVYGIIENHKGYITFESMQGKGAEFTFYLPAYSKKALEKEAENKWSSKEKRTILFVDDEEQIRNLVKMQLKNLGYEAIVARDGMEAVDVYAEKWHAIDLVVLDIIMPVMNGVETYHKLKNLNSSVKVVLTSGFSKDEKVIEILNDGAFDFIQKPFRINDLSKIISNALDSDERITPEM